MRAAGHIRRARNPFSRGLRDLRTHRTRPCLSIPEPPQTFAVPSPCPPASSGGQGGAAPQALRFRSFAFVGAFSPPEVRSHGAAKEFSPRRKPWVSQFEEPAPKGRKKDLYQQMHHPEPTSSELPDPRIPRPDARIGCNTHRI